MFQTLAVTKVINGISLSHLAIALSAISFMMALPAILEPKKFRESAEEFFGSSNALLRTAALFHLLIGFLIINSRWSIKFDTWKNFLWSLMAILGYLMIARGVVWFWFPNFVKNKARRFLQKEHSVYVVAAVGLIFAFGLGYLGIWVY